MVCLTIYNQFSPSLCYHCRWHYRNWHISLEFEPFTLLYRRVFSFFKGEGGQETRGRKRGGEKFQKNFMFIFTFQMYIHNSQPNISVMYLHHFVFCPFLLVFFQYCALFSLGMISMSKFITKSQQSNKPEIFVI